MEFEDRMLEDLQEIETTNAYGTVQENERIREDGRWQVNEEISELVETDVLLSFQELKLLLQSQGYLRITGIVLPEQRLSDEEVIQVLHQLTVKKVLVREEDRETLRLEDGLEETSEAKTEEMEAAESAHFAVDAQIGAMIRCMGEPEYSFPLNEERMDLPTSYCYQKEHLVLVSELYERKAQTMRLILFTQEEFQKWREERAQ